MLFLGIILIVATSAEASILQANTMMLCYTGNRFWDFIDYGCYCGQGGGGVVIDEIDECCKIHDECYGALTNTKPCYFTLWQYFVPYSYSCDAKKKELECHYSWWVSECGYEVCKCDLELTKCWSKFEKPKEEEKGRKPKEICFPPPSSEPKPQSNSSVNMNQKSQISDVFKMVRARLATLKR
ncbi:hypothetical protein AB6A40_006991 [Gnathostoma spinigerum]|uniref:Phospholipase A2 n=1 Tax=Gnathostoma spinigerum TaxID=75299 RepID=A0ABD6EUB0_9BILA